MKADQDPWSRYEKTNAQKQQSKVAKTTKSIIISWDKISESTMKEGQDHWNYGPVHYYKPMSNVLGKEDRTHTDMKPDEGM